jgi:Rhodanese-related sulfurtransferase
MNNMIKNMVFVMGLLFSFFCCAQEQSFVSFTPAEFEKLIKEDTTIQLVDVRRPDEYAAGHLDRAIMIDVSDSSFVAKANLLLDKSQPVAVYCRSGKRSKDAAKKLVKEGYKVYELDTGYLGWINRLNEQ